MFSIQISILNLKLKKNDIERLVQYYLKDFDVIFYSKNKKKQNEKISKII